MKSDAGKAGEILIIAAEASSALYALRLLQLFKKEKPSIRAFGIGDRAMEAEGFEILGRAEDLAVVGLQEVFAHWEKIKGAFDRVLLEVDRRKPKVALLMDYPGFNLRLAKKLKERGVKVVYYISPQIWAWKQNRVKTIQKYVDEMLVVLPFEEGFYAKHGVRVKFVGHPLLDEIDTTLLERVRQSQLREKNGIKADSLVLGLMPGSRRSEIHHHLDVQIETARQLRKKFPHLTVLLMVAPTLERDFIAEKIKSVEFPIVLVKREPFEMIAMADVVLCASGTATLMVGLMEKPMIIMYRAHPITAFVGKLVLRSKFFGLVNLIMDREVSPELLQIGADVLAPQLEPLLANESLRLEKARELSQLKGRLGSGGATSRVAAEIEGLL